MIPMVFPVDKYVHILDRKAIYRDLPSKRAVAFETSDMILTKEQAKHKYPPHRDQQPACIKI